MTAYLSTASLLLFPRSPAWHPQRIDTFSEHLSVLGLAGDSIDATRRYAGERLLDYITFMGCAPSIRFAPDITSDKYTHFRLHSFANITAMIGDHARAPSCPHCRKALDSWKTLPRVFKKNTAWRCGHCGESSAPWMYQWRRSAGFARVFIEITDIYPKEALPQQALFDALNPIGDIGWDYCYLF